MSAQAQLIEDHDADCHCIACKPWPIPQWSVSELTSFNAAWDFKRRGCAWAMLSDEQLARAHGLKRVLTGGDTGTLIGYERSRR